MKDKNGIVTGAVVSGLASGTLVAAGQPGMAAAVIAGALGSQMVSSVLLHKHNVYFALREYLRNHVDAFPQHLQYVEDKMHSQPLQDPNEVRQFLNSLDTVFKYDEISAHNFRSVKKVIYSYGPRAVERWADLRHEAWAEAAKNAGLPLKLMGLDAGSTRSKQFYVVSLDEYLAVFTIFIDDFFSRLEILGPAEAGL